MNDKTYGTDGIINTVEGESLNKKDFTTTILRIFYILSFLGFITFAILWHIYTNLPICYLFWGSIFTFFSLDVVIRIQRQENIVTIVAVFIFLLGATLNATVILANGGFMPVVDETAETFNIWVVATDKHNLLFLADRFAGFSLGDFIILSSIALRFCNWIVRKIIK